MIYGYVMKKQERKSKAEMLDITAYYILYTFIFSSFFPFVVALLFFISPTKKNLIILLLFE